MNTDNTKIVVIHDGLIPEVDPLILELYKEYSKESVIHFENSNHGLEYVLNNLNQKMIVLLDINFSQGELSGVKVFENIKQQTSLVAVIMITARSLNELSQDDLVSMINNDAFAIENVHKYPQIITLVNNAAHKMNVRIDSALEQWILSYPNNIDTPYIKNRNGKAFTLREMLKEVRTQSPDGKEIERNLFLLTIDLLIRKK